MLRVGVDPNIVVAITRDPISCINDGAVPTHVINTYCWITYTFSIPGQHGRSIGTEVAHSGLGNDNAEKTFHSYYQWVPFMLFFQTFSIWRFFSNGLLIGSISRAGGAISRVDGADGVTSGLSTS
uniref:Innexin n=1 Tax=Phlebotomus papatasi TaxID=29031 RepID=A0A1B0DHS3_PHLPP